VARRDDALERLLDLDGFLAEVGGGFWIKIISQRVPPGANRPHGVGYSLTLHDPSARRAFGIDNANGAVQAWAFQSSLDGSGSSAS
jgi:hypothetical protein